MEEIPLSQCFLEKGGTVTCKVGQTKFNNIQDKKIKPKRLVLEIE